MAIESYRTSCKLKDNGVIPQGIRFQVSVPTPLSTTWTNVEYAYRDRVEPFYMERLSLKTCDARRKASLLPPNSASRVSATTKLARFLPHGPHRPSAPSAGENQTNYIYPGRARQFGNCVVDVRLKEGGIEVRISVRHSGAATFAT